jgi:glyoxylase-like metal-dependent hydrolase (beta-lactamase superfamily II)
MPKGIETINRFSRLVTERMGLTRGVEEFDLEWRDDVSGRAIGEGGSIDIGDLRVQILETPGHSSCSISAYVPGLRALFPSDGGGIPYGEVVLPSGNSNFTRYQESLEKLKTLAVDLFCADHYGYVTGGEAQTYICRSIDEAREKRAMIEGLIRRTGSIEETVTELLDETYTKHPDYFLSPEISAGVYRQTVRHIAGALGEKAPL